jgi:dienelactone hydrolase
MRGFPRVVFLECIVRVGGVIITLCALVLGAPSCGGKQSSSGDERGIQTADGVELICSLYPPPNTKSPGVILVHDRSGSRRDLDTLAKRLQQNGFFAVSFDLRTLSERRDSNEKQLHSFEYFKRDLEAVKAFLIDRGADRTRLGIAGLGTGANVAASYAAGNLDMQALVMVSPGLECDGVEARSSVREYGKRPILFVVAESDAYSSSSCLQLKDAAKGNVELRQYPGGAHAAALVAESETLKEEIVLWFQQFLADAVTPTPAK